MFELKIESFHSGDYLVRFIIIIMIENKEENYNLELSC